MVHRYIRDASNPDASFIDDSDAGRFSGVFAKQPGRSAGRPEPQVFRYDQPAGRRHSQPIAESGQSARNCLTVGRPGHVADHATSSANRLRHTFAEGGATVGPRSHARFVAETNPSHLHGKPDRPYDFRSAHASLHDCLGFNKRTECLAQTDAARCAIMRIEASRIHISRRAAGRSPPSGCRLFRSAGF